MQIQALVRTDVGRHRDHNEDRYLSDDSLGLYIVCDGMGGHAAGEVAAELTIKTVREMVASELADIPSDGSLDARQTARIVSVMQRSVDTANKAVHALGKRDPRARGAGTTCSVLCVRAGRGFVAHVGDSRLYLRRGGQLHQLSLDHSFLAEALRRGMTREAAETMFSANLLTRAIGPLARVQVDTLCFDVLPGDTLLLCSDGLHGYFEDTQELGALLDENLESLPDRLVDLANERGGIDNITALVVHAHEAEARESSRRLSKLSEDLEALRVMELFVDLTYPELLEVAGALRTEEHPAGKLIVSEGDQSLCLYVVAAGSVRVERGGRVLGVLESGKHFGEMALLTNRPRTANVQTLEDSRLLALDQAAIYPLFQQNPVIGVKFLWKLSQIQSLRLDEATLFTPPDFEPAPPTERSLLGQTQELFPAPFSRRG